MTGCAYDSVGYPSRLQKMESKKKHKKETVGKPIHPHPSTLTTTLTGKPQINNYSFSQGTIKCRQLGAMLGLTGPIPDYKMITDNQLAFIANSLGVMTMLLIVVYHYVSINDVKRK
ncbi:hypothetical protein J3Q64DRAFT_1699933 [Phycomyces blakesleeanus]|uniref:Dolichyl-diphosphooligosaccharide--protein glycosyltransferase subunit 4 n=2 Tax=Phycomyces blakesleeanus TaxID=4837 RepID=A0A162U685_PHYB8|nr:hypothetical protein PHYBLDRAFT_145231 [Phycomyces blakesleeanus NRRL 1555(-)]OAD73762.1 hypothetical protein PHYBLDRAFT_145231 [Phycomyces blakesleeanus NRRL 1555(-)]|eukprot:XP_018291802.1 hypothetical protein PHYBLDRAFT_145231 [Phycomyces blakesleeanus NRRL 1555(-)]